MPKQDFSVKGQEVLDLIDSDYILLNEEFAKHYGIKDERFSHLGLMTF
jgi:hypothetical protein